jgi:hypothetical protein
MWYRTAKISDNEYKRLQALEPYDFFGISSNSTKDEIRSAYRTIARKFHPDLNPEDHNAHKIMLRANNLYPQMVERAPSIKDVPKTTHTSPNGHDEFIDSMRKKREEQRNRHLTPNEITRVALNMLSSFDSKDLRRIVDHLEMCNRCRQLYITALDLVKKQDEAKKPFNVFKRKMKDVFKF